ncbi:MAG: hypothetical protein JW904_08970 [Spirochaetales bacterium]|nr:hypothetical protein [Spirochaetales bacterium]
MFTQKKSICGSIFGNAAKEAQEYQISQWQKYENKAIDELKSKPGVTVTIPTPAVRQELSRQCSHCMKNSLPRFRI